MKNTNIINYLETKSKRKRSNKIIDKWKRCYVYLECNHSYIQWWFPLNEKSNHNHKAPILTEKDICEIQKNEMIKESIIYSFDVMLNFYGLERKYETTQVRRKNNYKFIKRRWIRNGNHNFLRITRILKCLKICGLEDYARGFYNELCNIYQENKFIIGKSINYWNDAINQ